MPSKEGQAAHAHRPAMFGGAKSLVGLKALPSPEVRPMRVSMPSEEGQAAHAWLQQAVGWLLAVDPQYIDLRGSCAPVMRTRVNQCHSWSSPHVRRSLPPSSVSASAGHTSVSQCVSQSCQPPSLSASLSKACLRQSVHRSATPISVIQQKPKSDVLLAAIPEPNAIRINTHILTVLSGNLQWIDSM